MTLPRTAAQVLSGHVRLEIRCIDRMLLTFRQPRLQYGQGIHGFFCHHRGNQFVSSALMRPMTERFAADIRHYIDVRGLDLVRFAKGQSKDQIARRYLAGHDGGEQLLFAGVAQEKTRIWRTRQRQDPVTGSDPLAVPGAGHGQPLVLLRVRRRFRPVDVPSPGTSPTPGRSTSTGTSTPSGSASRPGSASPPWTTRSAPN